MEFTLLWAALTAVGFGWLGLRLWPERVPDRGLDHLVGAAVAGLVAGRLTAVITQGVNPLTNLGDLIIIRGGVYTGAAAVGFLVTLLWTTRSNRGAIDALAPAILLALAGWHTGCLWRGACLGTAANLPWAWGLDGSGVTRHPVELYAAIGLTFGAWLVSRLGWRIWLRAGVALSIASVVRMATEPMRPSITGGPIGWYVAGVVIGVIAIAAGPRLSRTKVWAPT